MGKGARNKKKREGERQRKALAKLTSLGFMRYLRGTILDSGARLDSCIFSTKVVCRTAHAMGLRARPLTVEVTLLNPVFAGWFAEHGTDNTMPDDVFERLGNAGGRFLVVGDRSPTDDPTKWPGHLVAIVEGTEARQPPVLIDLSIDQAHRPQKGIVVVDPITFPITYQPFMSQRCDVMRFREDGVLIRYTSYPTDDSFKIAPDWQRDDVEVHP